MKTTADHFLKRENFNSSFSLLTIFFFFFVCNVLNAQEGIHMGRLKTPIPENFFSGSPDVMAFQKQNIVPVNLYTGKIDLKIPIFEIKSGDITVPIFISYNSGGIKVDDFSSSVGAGWSLNAGGNIIRIIKDLPDNEVGYSLYAESDWDLGIILNPILSGYGYNRKSGNPSPVYMEWGATNRHAVYAEINQTGTTPIPESNGFGGYWGTDLDAKDMSPDLFIANAPGLSSKFTTVNTSSYDIYPSNNLGFTSTFLDNDGTKMSSLVVDVRANSGYGFYAPNSTGNHNGMQTQPVKDFYEFNLISNQGLKYKFDEEEINETFYSPLGGTPDGSYPWKNLWATMETHNYSKRIHTWNLSSILDTKSSKSVTFSYNTYGNSNLIANTFINTGTSTGDYPYVTPDNNNCSFSINSFATTNYNFPGSYANWEKNPKRKRLTKITFDEGEIFFIYSNEREDYPGEKALDEIHIKNLHGKTIKKYVFSYGYFISKENCNQPECKRLKLNQLQEQFSDSSPKTYTFDYQYDVKLPKRGSLEQDFLGYYNINGVTGNSTSTNIIYPKLYFYPNRGYNSVVPFKLNNDATNINLPGQIDFTPNSSSLTGLLRKITYPTGGSSEFVYENNKFQYRGEEYIAGGARIKSQKLVDSNNTAKQIHYSYLETDNKTSGYINNIPVYGYLSDFQLTPFLAKSFNVYDKPKGGLELTSGSYVGYSRVVESETNNGSTVYNFSSPKNNPNISETRQFHQTSETTAINSINCTNIFIQNSAYPNLTYIDNDHQRGKLLDKSIYDNSGNLVENENHQYTNRVISTTNIEKRVKITGNPEDSYFRHQIKVSSQVPIAQNLLTGSNFEKPSSSGTIKTKKTFSYHPNYPFIAEEQFQETIFGANGADQYKIKRLYVTDSQFDNTTFINYLRNQNRINEVIKTEILKNNTLISSDLLNYSTFGSLILPRSISKAKGNTSLIEEINTISKRDDYGNITELKNTAETTFSCNIWGYNKTKLIARIENSQLDAIPQTTIDNLQSLSNTDNDNCRTSNCKEEQLRVALNNLRDSLPDAMVTSYTYDPLIGVTSITNPRGETIYYIYDTQGRLKEVKDLNGNLINSNDYNYKPQ